MNTDVQTRPNNAHEMVNPVNSDQTVVCRTLRINTVAMVIKLQSGFTLIFYYLQLYFH